MLDLCDGSEYFKGGTLVWVLTSQSRCAYILGWERSTLMSKSLNLEKGGTMDSMGG